MVVVLVVKYIFYFLNYEVQPVLPCLRISVINVCYLCDLGLNFDLT